MKIGQLVARSHEPAYVGEVIELRDDKAWVRFFKTVRTSDGATVLWKTPRRYWVSIDKLITAA